MQNIYEKFFLFLLTIPYFSLSLMASKDTMAMEKTLGSEIPYKKSSVLNFQSKAKKKHKNKRQKKISQYIKSQNQKLKILDCESLKDQCPIEKITENYITNNYFNDLKTIALKNFCNTYSINDVKNIENTMGFFVCDIIEHSTYEYLEYLVQRAVEIYRDIEEKCMTCVTTFQQETLYLTSYMRDKKQEGAEKYSRFFQQDTTQNISNIFFNNDFLFIVFDTVREILMQYHGTTISYKIPKQHKNYDMKDIKSFCNFLENYFMGDGNFHQEEDCIMGENENFNGHFSPHSSSLKTQNKSLEKYYCDSPKFSLFSLDSSLFSMDDEDFLPQYSDISQSDKIYSPCTKKNADKYFHNEDSEGEKES